MRKKTQLDALEDEKEEYRKKVETENANRENRIREEENRRRQQLEFEKIDEEEIKLRREKEKEDIENKRRLAEEENDRKKKRSRR